MGGLILRQNEPLVVSKLMLASQVMIGSSLDSIARYIDTDIRYVDHRDDGKCADTIREIAWLAGVDLGLSTPQSCPDREAVERHRVTIHPGNPNSFRGRPLSPESVGRGDLILFHDTDPRYAGTGLVTHVGMVVDIERKLMVDASFQKKIVCYRPWSTFPEDQVFGFWRLEAVEKPPDRESQARRSFGEYTRRRRAIDSVIDRSRGEVLRAWNDSLRGREVEEILQENRVRGPLRELLSLERERFGRRSTFEPTFEQLGPLLEPEVHRGLPVAGKVMETLSGWLSRRGWHRAARDWRRKLGLFSRAQSAVASPDLWQEPLGYRNFNSGVHLNWLRGFFGERSFRRVLKTDLHDESFSEGLVSALLSSSEAVFGIDIDGAVQRKAQERYPQLEALLADARELPFPQDFFQLVVSNSTFDHFASRSEIEESLREVARVTEPGGYLAITLDNPENPMISFRNSLPGSDILNRLGLAPYFRGETLSLQALCESLEEHGYDILDRDYVFHTPRVLLVHLVGRFRSLESLYPKFLKWEQRIPRFLRAKTGYFVAVVARKRSKS